MSKDKHGDIKAAALQLFAERGYDGTTVPMIAKKASVGAGTIYHYYESKEALVNSLYVDYVTELTDIFTSKFPDTTDTKEQFFYIYHRLFHYAKDNKNAFLFICCHENGHYLDERSVVTFQKMLSFFDDAIEKGKSRGHIRSLDTLALIAIVYSPMEMLIKLIDSGDLTYSEQFLDELTTSAWDAIRII